MHYYEGTTRIPRRAETNLSRELLCCIGKIGSEPLHGVLPGLSDTAPARPAGRVGKLFSRSRSTTYHTL